MILVLGAGGQVGSAVLAELRATGQQTRAVYHSPAKAARARVDGHEAVTADLSEPGGLPAAFAGGRALFLLGAMSPQQTAQELNAVHAAEAAGITRIVKLSVWRAPEELTPIARLRRRDHPPHHQPARRPPHPPTPGDSGPPGPPTRAAATGGDGDKETATGQLASLLAAAIGQLPRPLGGPSAALDIGRASQSWTPRQRDALYALYGGRCGAPGCTRPIEVIHHIIHWLHGGKTKISNGMPFCGFDHWRVHEGGWQLTRRPDGSVLMRPPPPGWRPGTIYRRGKPLPDTAPST